VTRGDPDPERSEPVAERIDGRNYGDRDGFDKRDDRRGRCDDCGEIGTGPVTVDGSTGVAGWRCPACANVQEPPRPVDSDESDD